MKLSEAVFGKGLQIKNILFDLGGVIIDLDFERCSREFEKLGIAGFGTHFNLLSQHTVYRDFEKGIISPEKFRDALRSLMKTPATDRQIDHAWMSMLGDIPEERVELLYQISRCYRIFLLSNTNRIHMQKSVSMPGEGSGNSKYLQIFEKNYFSCELGMRKPDAEIFQFVLNDSRLDACETLLIDDSLQNIESARKLGMHAFLLKNPLTLTNLFNDEQDKN